MKSALMVVAVATNCVAGYAQDTNTGSAPAAAVVSGPSTEVMPLVVINDAPLPDAVKNLARQAGINIQFDPKAEAGPIDPKTNLPGPPPTVNFHWENVTAMQALQALLENYNLQLIEDKKTRIARVTPKEPNALEPLVPRVISVRYSQPTNMIPFIKASIGSRGQVIPDPRTGQLLVLATEKEQISVEELVARLDSPPSQILIEARFIETRKNPRTAKGVDWTGTFAANNVSFGNRTFFEEGLEPTAPTPTQPLFPGVSSGVLADPKIIMSTAGGFNGIGFLNSDGLNAVVSFLNTDNETETLATPRAVALEGVPTELSVIQNVPIFEEEQAPTTGGSVPPATVKARYDLTVNGTLLSEIGTKLIVTPRIYGVTNVFLDLKPEVSTRGLDERVTFNGRTSQAPTFFRKKIQTQAMVPSGNTLVLGGLNEDRNAKVLTKVPLLGDIPGLGRAFRSDAKSKDKTQILIFVTPTILSFDDFLPGEESRDFLLQKPVEKPDVSWGPYDGAQPKDWTEPVE